MAKIREIKKGFAVSTEQEFHALKLRIENIVIRGFLTKLEDEIIWD